MAEELRGGSGSKLSHGGLGPGTRPRRGRSAAGLTGSVLAKEGCLPEWAKVHVGQDKKPRNLSRPQCGPWDWPSGRGPARLHRTSLCFGISQSPFGATPARDPP